MKIGTQKKVLKNTITGKVFWKKRRQKEKNKKLRLSRCLQTNRWLHFSEDQQFLRMDSYSYSLVEYGETVPLKTLYVVHIYSERTITLNHPLQFRPVNNQFQYVNFVQYFSRNKILNKGCSNNHITWSLLLQLQTASLFITQTQ